MILIVVGRHVRIQGRRQNQIRMYVRSIKHVRLRVPVWLNILVFILSLTYWVEPTVATYRFVVHSYVNASLHNVEDRNDELHALVAWTHLGLRDAPLFEGLSPRIPRRLEGAEDGPEMFCFRRLGNRLLSVCINWKILRQVLDAC